MKILSAVFCLGVFSAGAFASPGSLTLEQIQSRLARSHAKWNASANWVTRLSPEARRQLLGVPLDASAGAHFVDRGDARRRRVDLPEELDWRDVNGHSFSSPILNQGRCGSCVAFAAIGTLETQTNITRNTPDSPWAFSPQYIFACGGGACGHGWQPEQAAQFLQFTGVPDEACFPYTEGVLGHDVACGGACSDAGQRALKITSYSRPTQSFASIDAVKEALTRGPLVTVMTVYEDFFFYNGGVYEHATGNVAGAHAVAIVGYSEEDRAWIVRNSWGADWGDHGYVMFSWDDVSGIGNDTWQYEVPDAAGFVTLGSLRDRAVLKGVVKLDIESSFPDTGSVEWTLSHGGRFVAWGGRNETLDTTEYEDGIYTLIAGAHHGDNKTDLSQPRVVYILNGELHGELAFTNVVAEQTIDPKKFVLEMTTKSSPVPFTKVTFHARHVETGEAFEKATGNVGPQMAMSWRMDVPDGEYDLWLEGSTGTEAVTSERVRVSVE